MLKFNVFQQILWDCKYCVLRLLSFFSIVSSCSSLYVCKGISITGKELRLCSPVQWHIGISILGKSRPIGWPTDCHLLNLHPLPLITVTISLFISRRVCLAFCMIRDGVSWQIVRHLGIFLLSSRRSDFDLDIQSKCWRWSVFILTVASCQHY